MVRIGLTISERHTNFRWHRALKISPNEPDANLGGVISRRNDHIFVLPMYACDND